MVLSRSLLPILFLAGSLAASPAALASDEERLTIARTYLKMSVESMNLDKMVDVSITPILKAVEKNQPDLYAEKKDRLRSIAKSVMEQTLTDALSGLDKTLAQIFTLEELRALQNFYSSQTGKSVMRKMPQYTAALQPTMVRALQTALPDLLQRFEAEGVKLK